MSNYDNEYTQYQNPEDEATQFEDTTSEQIEETISEPTSDETASTSENDEVEVKDIKKSGWKRTAVGAASGLLIGGVSTFLMGMKKADDPTDDNGDHTEGNHREELSNPDWVDDNIQVATSVNDDMTFNEAFAAARAEVGPGGCFEWHGNVYGTYTAEEWNHMTAAERAEWSDHFSWNHIDHTQSNVAQHSATANHTTTNNTAHASTHDTTHSASNATAQAETNDDDIEVVSVNHNDNNNIAQNQQANVNHTTDDVVVDHVDPEIEILGVVHDSEANVNIGGMSIDGQEVILIDIDNDITFDYMAMDVNNNGQIDQEELVDIQDQNLTVNDLGGFSNPTGDLYADNNDMDYSNDMAYDG